MLIYSRCVCAPEPSQCLFQKPAATEGAHTAADQSERHQLLRPYKVKHGAAAEKCIHALYLSKSKDTFVKVKVLIQLLYSSTREEGQVLKCKKKKNRVCFSNQRNNVFVEKATTYLLKKLCQQQQQQEHSSNSSTSSTSNLNHKQISKLNISKE